MDGLSDQYVINLSSYFHVWSGVFSPYFTVDEVAVPDTNEVLRVARQLRTLVFKDPDVEYQFLRLHGRCKRMRHNLASCTQVNDSGPLRKILASLKRPLYESIWRFEANSMRGFFRRFLYDVQPGAKYVWDILPSLRVKAADSVITVNLEVRRGVNAHLSSGHPKSLLEDFEAKVALYNALVEENEDLWTCDFQLTKLQWAVIEAMA